MIENLSKMLCDVTGYDSISMQSNSGARESMLDCLQLGDTINHGEIITETFV